MSKLYEEVNPFQYTGKGKMDVRDDAVRDNINTLLTGALMACTLTPYIALEKVRKVLAYYHISIPGTSFMEGDRGIKTFEVEQFGLKFGMKNDGQIVNFNSVDKDMTHGAHIDGENFNYFTAPGTENTDEKYHIYFEYKMNDKGLFDVFSEIVTDDELEDLLDDAEEDINADKSEDDRDERLNEAKNVATKVLNELRLPSGIVPSDYKDTKRLPPRIVPSDYKDTKRLPRGIVPSDYEQKKPFDPSNRPADTGSNISRDSNPAHTKPGGDSGPPAGTDPFKGVTPRRMGDPGYGDRPSGPNSMHSSTLIPSTGYTLPDKQQSGPAPGSFRAAQETGIQQQKSQIQETSHESVNHVRRLAMKNTIKEELPLSTVRRPTNFAAAARSPEAPGQPGSPERQAAADRIGRAISPFIPGASSGPLIAQGDYTGALKSAAVDAVLTGTGLGAVKGGVMTGKALAPSISPLIAGAAGKITHSAGTTGLKVMGMPSDTASTTKDPASDVAPASARGQMQEDEYQMFKNAGASIAKSAMVSAATGAASGFARGGIPGAVVGGLQSTTKTPETSNSELTAIQGANLDNAKRLAPASTKHLIPIQRKPDESNLPNIPEESSYESVNHVRKLAMKNKRNDR